MERVMISPIPPLTYQHPYPSSQTYYMNIPCEYNDIYWYKMMLINSTTYAADEQSKRILEGLNKIKK